MIDDVLTAYPQAQLVSQAQLANASYPELGCFSLRGKGGVSLCRNVVPALGDGCRTGGCAINEEDVVMETVNGTATVKMTYTDDTEHRSPGGTVFRVAATNAVMKDVIRDCIGRNRGGFRPVMPRNVPQPFDPVRFIQVSEDAAWIALRSTTCRATWDG
ncbi:MAG: hypothetical protein IPK19_37800 [Chloroflexi bacterium]|nr:hypothetical protein [Chloroflexota bacterium]